MVHRMLECFFRAGRYFRTAVLSGGCISPDNDYTPVNPKNHYRKFALLGCYTGSAINDGLYELKKSLDRKKN